MPEQENTHFASVASFVLALCAGVLMLSFSSLDYAAMLRHKVPVPSRGYLMVSGPATWQATVEKATDLSSPEIIFLAPNSDSKLTLTILPEVDSHRNLYRFVAQISQAALVQAVEKTVEIKEFGAENKKGFYFRLTENTPKPNEWVYRTQGAIHEGNLLLIFTLLSNDPKTKEQQIVFNMLVSARQVR